MGLGEGLGDGQKKANRDGQGKLEVWIRGRFGGPSGMMFSIFSAVVVLVSGSGIAFGLSMVEELRMQVRVSSGVLSSFGSFLILVRTPSRLYYFPNPSDVL